MPSGTGTLSSQSNPSRELERPRIEATDRSMSFAMTMRVKGNAIRAISTKLARRFVQLSTVRKSLLERMPPSIAITSRLARMVFPADSAGKTSRAGLALTHTRLHFTRDRSAFR